jgi:hypothetical protein
MTPARISSQLNRAWRVLEELGLGESRNTPKYPPDLPAAMRSRTYREGWAYLLANRHYDFLLSDLSLMLFMHEVDDEGVLQIAGYSHYPSPVLVNTYEEFVLDMGFTLEEAGDELRADYEQHVDAADFRASVTPIRYDYSPRLYSCGRHPAAHFHFGKDNEIRIGTERILKPIGFVLFIVRQCYPEDWVRYLVRDGRSDFVRKHMRGGLDWVQPEYMRGHDLLELILR